MQRNNGSRPPFGVSADFDSDALRIVCWWLSVWTVATAVSCVPFLAMIAIFVRHWADWMSLEAGVALGLVSVGLIYYGISGLVNRTVIRVSPEEMRVRHGPLPWLGNRTFATKDLMDLYYREVESHIDVRGAWIPANRHHLTAILGTGNSVRLLRGFFSARRVLFVKGLIECYLSSCPSAQSKWALPDDLAGHPVGQNDPAAEPFAMQP